MAISWRCDITGNDVYTAVVICVWSGLDIGATITVFNSCRRLILYLLLCISYIFDNILACHSGMYGNGSWHPSVTFNTSCFYKTHTSIQYTIVWLQALLTSIFGKCLMLIHTIVVCACIHEAGTNSLRSEIFLHNVSLISGCHLIRPTGFLDLPLHSSQALDKNVSTIWGPEIPADRLVV